MSFPNIIPNKDFKGLIDVRHIRPSKSKPTFVLLGTIDIDQTEPGYITTSRVMAMHWVENDIGDMVWMAETMNSVYLLDISPDLIDQIKQEYPDLVRV